MTYVLHFAHQDQQNLTASQLLANIRFAGACDTAVGNTWQEQALLPELRPGQTVLMDNAPSHQSGATKALIETKGCHLKYLPTYSPDLNPIEPQWAILKGSVEKSRQRRSLPSPGLLRRSGYEG